MESRVKALIVKKSIVSYDLISIARDFSFIQLETREEGKKGQVYKIRMDTWNEGGKENKKEQTKEGTKEGKKLGKEEGHREVRKERTAVRKEE